MNKKEIEKAISILQRDTENYKRLLIEQPNSPVKQRIESEILACETAISTLTQQLNNGWIPVSEQLPKEGEKRHVYVTVKHIEGTGCFTAEMIWEYGSFIWPNGKRVADKWEVLAWMPERYPEPYKETDKEL